MLWCKLMVGLPVLYDIVLFSTDISNESRFPGLSAFL
uniref:Uncharacterized protein n=1 Tax=Anguilla anguilla TaxID=7936 RepID=A0A0E9XRR8_ANGAN